MFDPPVIDTPVQETDNVFKEIEREEAQQEAIQTTQVHQGPDQETHDPATTSPRSSIGSKKRARVVDDSETDEEEVQRLRAKKGKVVMVKEPKKKKRAELDERIFAERQRKGVELTRSTSSPASTRKSSDDLDVKEMIKRMDARISGQAKIIRAQNEKIADQDELIKDMHTLITFQGNQIDSLIQAFSLFTKDKSKDDDQANKADDVDKIGDKNAEG